MWGAQGEVFVSGVESTFVFLPSSRLLFGSVSHIRVQECVKATQR